MTRQAVALWDAMPAERAAAAYADLIINRVERRMPTDSWSINWDDAPTDQKVYPSAQRLVLPTPTSSSTRMPAPWPPSCSTRSGTRCATWEL